MKHEPEGEFRLDNTSRNSDPATLAPLRAKDTKKLRPESKRLSRANRSDVSH